MSRARRLALAAALAMALAFSGRPAFAADDDDRALAAQREEHFHAGVDALAANKPQDAIFALEAVRDLGTEDASVSFDLGLAYLARARIAETPGDLGRAVHSFEEAKALTKDDAFRGECALLVGEIRALVAKRRARLGLTTDMEESPPPSRAFARLLSEDAWAAFALAASIALFVALSLRWKAAGRARVAGSILSVASGLALVIAAYATRVRAVDRETLEEAVVVVDEVRLTDEKHIVLTDAPSLAAGTNVTVEERRAGYAHVRTHKMTAWIPERAILGLPKER